MLKIKKILISSLILVTCSFAHADNQVIRIATEGAYPPYNFVKPDGSLGGFDVDIANALCAEMKVQCKLVKQDWDGIIPGLMAKKYDAIVSSMAITPEREKKVAFSDKYEGGYSMLFGSKSLTDSSPAALQGKIIAVQKGSIQENFAKDYFEKAGIRVPRYSDTQMALMDLKAGRVDAVVLEVAIIADAQKDPNLSAYQAFGEKFDDPTFFGTGSGIAVRKADQALLGQFNQALKTVLANGTYKQINDKYFTYDQYE
ncbi:transporter substrate-binding domain-containing protein [Pseudomonas kielensis]|uniref:transporter substrate-binding domain-containing protein n=1 Tax=Pseudomonas TaxID=286 RepID=UPI001412C589|nr:MULTISPECIES: transporter substrate-binding domain-containing protein [Pseudomonas]NBB32506.1 transporter substrate-binding domain-containing protein [Pseudomonas sp. BC115LW]WKL54921.1 transporter substrate-binding domain-containing protein [Pseudomonas kielensis]